MNYFPKFFLPFQISVHHFLRNHQALASPDEKDKPRNNLRIWTLQAGRCQISVHQTCTEQSYRKKKEALTLLILTSWDNVCFLTGETFAIVISRYITRRRSTFLLKPCNPVSYKKYLYAAMVLLTSLESCSMLDSALSNWIRCICNSLTGTALGR